MISRKSVRRTFIRVAAVFVAAACLDGCSGSTPTDDATIEQRVEVDKYDPAYRATSTNTSVKGVAQNSTIEVTIYAVRCAGASGAAKRRCLAANKAIQAAWKGVDKPFTDPVTGKAYATGAEWAKDNALFSNFTRDLRAGATWSLASELKDLDIPRTDGDKVVSLFFFADIKVRSGVCDVKPKATTVSVVAECGDGRVSITEEPAPSTNSPDAPAVLPGLGPITLPMDQ